MLISSRGQHEKYFIKDLKPCDLTHSDVATHMFSLVTKINLSPHMPAWPITILPRPSLTNRADQSPPWPPAERSGLIPAPHLHPRSHSVGEGTSLTEKDLRGMKKGEELGQLDQFSDRLEQQLIYRMSPLVIGLYKWRGERRGKKKTRREQE